MSALDIFKNQYKVPIADDFVTTYHAKLQVKGVIVGGIPSNPSVIRSWLTARMEMGDAALEELLNQTIAERNAPLTVEEKVDALAKSSVAPSVNGFKRNDDGILCYEGRCMKAALKESSNSSFPGTDYFGKKEATGVAPRKGLMGTMVERIFVSELLIPLGVTEPTRVEERVKHVMTPQGPRSAINIVEVVERPVLEFDIKVHDDFLAYEAWAKIWQRCEDIGIGADRGRSDGAFELLGFDKVV